VGAVFCSLVDPNEGGIDRRLVEGGQGKSGEGRRKRDRGLMFRFWERCSAIEIPMGCRSKSKGRKEGRERGFA